MNCNVIRKGLLLFFRDKNLRFFLFYFIFRDKTRSINERPIMTQDHRRDKLTERHADGKKGVHQGPKNIDLPFGN